MIKSVTLLRLIAYPSRLFSRLSCGVAAVALSGLGLLFLPTVAGGESGTIQSTVSILTPLHVSGESELEFGIVIPGETEGRVIVTTANVRYTTGGVSAFGSDYHRADFLVSGNPNFSYFISALAVLELESNTPPAVALEITDLTIFSSNVGTETTIGLIDAGGTDIVLVGGTLLVPPTATKGSYEGEIELIVHY